METNQLICRASQLTDFYIMPTLPFNDLMLFIKVSKVQSCKLCNNKYMIASTQICAST